MGDTYRMTLHQGGVGRERLRRLASELSICDADLGRRTTAALDSCFARIRVQVTGRVGVGKSSVRAVLDRHDDLRSEQVEITESSPVDEPRSPDPVLDGDVLVHVVAGGAQPADVEVVSSASALVVVLAKADTVDDVPSVLARLTHVLGVPVLPLSGIIANTVLVGEPASFDGVRDALESISDDVLLTPERFESAECSMSMQQRRDLVDRIEMLGVRTVVAALREDRDRSATRLRRALAEVSGLTPVIDAVRSTIGGVRVDREGVLLHRLTELCFEFPTASDALEEYLASDEAVLAIMRSALRASGESESSGPPLDAALAWHRRALSGDPSRRRAALAISRGYLRMQSA